MMARSSMTAMTRIVAPQCGQSRGSTSYDCMDAGGRAKQDARAKTCLISLAQFACAWRSGGVSFRGKVVVASSKFV